MCVCVCGVYAYKFTVCCRFDNIFVMYHPMIKCRRDRNFNFTS